VFKENAISGKPIIVFPVLHRDPIGIHFGHTIRAAGIKRCGFTLRHFLYQSIQFRRGGLVDFCFLGKSEQSNGFQYAQCSDPVGIRGILRYIKAHFHMAHGPQVVYFIRLHLLDDTDQVRAVGQIAIMENKPAARFMRVRIEMIDPVGIEKRGSPLYTMDLVSFFQ